MEKKTYSIDELASLTGLNRRTIRYYVQEGLIDPPAGRGRGGFYYDSHLGNLRQIRHLQEQGASLQAIRTLLHAGDVRQPAPQSPEREVWTRIAIISGLEIHVSKELELKQRTKVNELLKIAALLMKEDSAG